MVSVKLKSNNSLVFLSCIALKEVFYFNKIAQKSTLFTVKNITKWTK